MHTLGAVVHQGTRASAAIEALARVHCQGVHWHTIEVRLNEICTSQTVVGEKSVRVTLLSERGVNSIEFPRCVLQILMEVVDVVNSWKVHQQAISNRIIVIDLC